MFDHLAGALQFTAFNMIGNFRKFRLSSMRDFEERAPLVSIRHFSKEQENGTTH